MACNVSSYHCILYLIGANLIYREGGGGGGGGWTAPGSWETTRSVRQKVKPSACHTTAL